MNPIAITPDNWTFCHYTTGALKAQLHMGADLIHDQQYQELFFLNILSSSGELVLQKNFEDLECGLDFINRQFSHWIFVDETRSPSDSSSGCGSCVAH